MSDHEITDEQAQQFIDNGARHDAEMAKQRRDEPSVADGIHAIGYREGYKEATAHERARIRKAVNDISSLNEQKRRGVLGPDGRAGAAVILEAVFRIIDPEGT